MSREFTMGARLTLVDDFSNPIKEAYRATQEFMQATMQADNSASQLTRELNDMNSAHNEVSQAAKQASQSLETAAKSTDQLGNEQQNAHREAQQLTRQMQQAGDNATEASRDFRRLGESTNKASQNMHGMSGTTGRLTGALRGLPGIISAVAGSMALVGGYNWLIDSNAQMEQYKNTLSTVLGSQEKAVDTLAWANKFAASTPFEIPQIVEATTVMSAYGMQAQDTLGVIGDMASVMGKDLMQAVEAVADANTGELERLKEFGITKKMIEEQAALMGKTPFDSKGSLKDQEALNATLFAIMEERYSGGMAIQAKSFNGMLSNLSDFTAGVGRKMGQPLFEGFKNQLAGVLDFLNRIESNGSIDRFIKGLYTFGGVTGKVLSEIGPLLAGMAIAWASYGAILLGLQVKTLAYAAALYVYRAAVLAVNVVTMLLRGQFVALWFTMLASPVGLVVTALGLLIGVGFLLVKNWDRVKAAFTATFGFMAPYMEIAKQALIGFGQTAISSIGPAMDWVGQKFSAAKEWGKGIMASLGPIGETVRNSFTTIGNTIATISPLVARLGLSFLGVSGPIGWAIAAVVSLGAFLFKLVNNNESVKASLLAGWGSIKSGLQPLLAAFGQMVQMFATALGPAIQEFATAFAVLGPEFTKTGQLITQSFIALAPTFVELGSAVGQLVSVVLQLLPQLIPPILQIVTTVLPILLQTVAQVFPMVLTIVQAVVPVLVQIVLTLVPVILQIAQAILPLILQVVQMVFPVILQIIQTVIPIVVQTIMLLVPIILQIAQTVIPLILQAVQLVFPVILQIISAVIPIITALLTLAAKIITGVLVPTIQIILKVVQIVFPLVMTIIQNAMTLITGIIKTATALLQGDWSGAWSAIKETATTIMDNIISFFESIDLAQTGEDIIQGLINGIGSMARAAADKVREVAGGIKDAVTGFFDINSPSRVFRTEVGQQLGAGLILGMNDSRKGLVKAATNMAAAAMPSTGASLASQLEIAANMSIPAVPRLSTFLDVATNFDGKNAPSYAVSAGEVNATGNSVRGNGSASRSTILSIVKGAIQINATDGRSNEELAEFIMSYIQEKLEAADEILSSADMAQLL